MAEQDDRQARVVARDQVVNRIDVTQNLAMRRFGAEMAEWRVGRGRLPVAAMVVCIGMEAMGRHRIGEAFVADGVLGHAVIDLDDAARLAFGLTEVDVQRRAGRRGVGDRTGEGHAAGSCEGDRL